MDTWVLGGLERETAKGATGCTRGRKSGRIIGEEEETPGFEVIKRIRPLFIIPADTSADVPSAGIIKATGDPTDSSFF